jgi:hypothetical protein
MVPKDYQEDPQAKAAFDAAFADFNKKQGRTKVPTCNIARDTQVEPYRLWWEVQAWGGVGKVRAPLLVLIAAMLSHAASTGKQHCWCTSLQPSGADTATVHTHCAAACTR